MTRRLGWGVLFGAAVLVTGAVRQARADDDPKNLYDVTFHANPKVKKGHSGTLTVKIVAKNGGELHDETPLSVSVHAPENVAFSKDKYTRSDAKVSPGETVVDAPFTAKAKGKSDVEATLSFVICNSTNCFPQKVKGTVKVAVE